MTHLPFLYPSRLLIPEFDSIFVEIGFGGGDFILEQALANPKALWVGFEIKNRRYDNLVRRVQKQKIENIQLVQAPAESAFSTLLSEASVEAIFILFPDPWPKRKHAENRIWNREFLSTCWNTLKVGGVLHLATDDTPYLQQGLQVIESIGGFATAEPKIITTHYARKWKQAARPLHRYSFRKESRHQSVP